MVSVRAVRPTSTQFSPNHTSEPTSRASTFSIFILPFSGNITRQMNCQTPFICLLNFFLTCTLHQVHSFNCSFSLRLLWSRYIWRPWLAESSAHLWAEQVVCERAAPHFFVFTWGAWRWLMGMNWRLRIIWSSAVIEINIKAPACFQSMYFQLLTAAAAAAVWDQRLTAYSSLCCLC